MTKKQINLRLDTNLLDEIADLAKKSNLDRTQWINKALEAVILAIKNENSLEDEYKKDLGGTSKVTGTSEVPAQRCLGVPHVGVYKDCQSNDLFESLG